MGDPAGFVQTSFLGGEWSPLMQGRLDLPKYRQALNLCTNAIVMEEGALPRRSGTRQLGNTRYGAPGRVMGWAPAQNLPYQLEFTSYRLRFWQGFDLVLDADQFSVASVSTATPAIVTVNGVPGWSTGDEVVFTVDDSQAEPTDFGLQGRVFQITQTGSSTFSLQDDVTGAGVDGTTLGWVSSSICAVGRATSLTTPWGGDTWSVNRLVPFANAQNQTLAAVLSSSEPQLLAASNLGPGLTTFSLSNLNPVDGPYFDPINGATLVVGAGTSTPVYRITVPNSWVSTSHYFTDEVVEYAGFAYMSVIGSPEVGGQPTNIGNIPGTNSAWVLMNFPAANATDPTSIPAWSSGGAYIPWNATYGGGPGSLVIYGGATYAACYNGFFAFGNHTPGTTYSGNATDWVQVETAQVAAELSGVITLQLTLAAWAAGTLYAAGDAVSYGGAQYQSLANGNLGQTPGPVSVWWTTVNAGLAFGPDGAQSTDVGRQLRLFYQPPAWNSTTYYASGASVTFNGAYYQAVNSSTGIEPDISVADWLPTAAVAFWTTAVITSVISPTSVTAQITGAPLTDTTPITIYQVGVYTASKNQWPSVGCFYQGRLWLAGAVPNRIDSSTSDNPLVFTPTGPDGTVADNNGISLVINSDDNETIQWMKGTQQGILVGTLTREWLINASSTADPITPATVEVNPVTHYGSAFIEPKIMGLAVVFVQTFKRKIMEMVANVFSGKYNAPDLALSGKHLTTPGVEEIAYQEELAPVLWARMGDGSLAGCTYRRIAAYQTDNPVLLAEPSTFAAWHRHNLGTGRTVQSITTTYMPGGVLDTVGMVTQDSGGANWVELLMPLADAGNTLFDAWYLDGASTPTGTSDVTVGSQVYARYYGLAAYAGETVTVWASGLDCGDYTVNALGYVDIPYGVAAGGLFTAAYVTANAGQDYGWAAADQTTATVNIPGETIYTTTPAGLGLLAFVPNSSPGVMTDIATGDIDWSNNILVSINGGIISPTWGRAATNGMRVYNATTGAELIEAATTTILPSGGFIGPPYTPGGTQGCLGTDGYYYAQMDTYLSDGALLGRLAKIRLSDLTVVATFGSVVTTGSIDQPSGALGINILAVDMCPMTCQGTTYLISTQGSSGALTTVFNVDNPSSHTAMTYTGFSQRVSGGDNEGTAVFCKAYDTVTEGAAYGVDRWVSSGTVPSFNLYKMTVSSTGILSLTTVATVAASQLGLASWESTVSLLYDKTDGNVMVLAIANGSSNGPWLMKINVTDGGLMWFVDGISNSTILTSGILRNTIITNGMFGYLNGVSPPTLSLINTLTGAITYQVIVPGLSPANNSSVQAYDSATSSLVTFLGGTPGYDSTATGAPVPLGSTPSTFTGWVDLEVVGGTTTVTTTTTTTTVSTQGVPVIVGAPFTTGCQIVRPALAQETGSKTGPAQGETRRVHQMSALLYNTQGISFGTSFALMYPAPLADFPGAPTYGLNKLYSGVLWTNLPDIYSFDGMLCWQITRPYPATVVNVGCWLHTSER